MINGFNSDLFMVIPTNWENREKWVLITKFSSRDDFYLARVAQQYQDQTCLCWEVYHESSGKISQVVHYPAENIFRGSETNVSIVTKVWSHFFEVRSYHWLIRLCERFPSQIPISAAPPKIADSGFRTAMKIAWLCPPLPIFPPKMCHCMKLQASGGIL